MWGQKKSRGGRKSIFAAQMAANWGFMVLVDNSSTQSHVVRDTRKKFIESIDSVQKQITIQTVALNVISLRSDQVQRYKKTPNEIYLGARRKAMTSA